MSLLQYISKIPLIVEDLGDLEEIAPIKEKLHKYSSMRETTISVRYESRLMSRKSEMPLIVEDLEEITSREGK
jgi:hypothetical protein